MSFYHSLITEQSWQFLTQLKRKYDFILIGGWAVFLYTQALKSKDIDLVVEYDELEKLRGEFPVSKNERLRKYELKKEAVEVDIYLPYYSNPGLPAEELKKYLWTIEGFKTVKKEILAILKGKALLARKDSLKGRKDLIDLFSLLILPDFNWPSFEKMVRLYKLDREMSQIRETIAQVREIKESDLNPHQTARLKKKGLLNLDKILAI